MLKPLGGRGKKAPYQTTHVRVPVPLKPAIELMIDNYRRSCLMHSEPIKYSLEFLGNKSLSIIAKSRTRDKAVIRRAFAELLAISEDDLK